MSSSVCQGLQSCLEPRRVEPRVLSLKLTPCRPSTDSDATAQMKVAAAQTGAADWSFLHAFSTVEEKSEGEQGVVYVHPLLKCSSSFLSDWSLRICTEVLGNETSNDSGGDGEAPLLLRGGGSGNRRPAIRPLRNKLTRSCSFPPPLTSVGGSTGVQVLSRREGGRLVVEAVAVSSPLSFFHVERSHGHLKVRFSGGSDAPETEAKGKEEEKEVEAESEEAQDEFEEEEENTRVDGEYCDHEELEEEEEGEEGEGMEGNSRSIGGENGNGKRLRPSMRWCKEGAAMNWKPKPCWVAT